VTSLCWPCDVKYNLIAHSETLREDFEYLTRRVVGVMIANFSFNHMGEDVKTDAIADTVDSAFTFYHNLTACISRYEI
jgi:hypothetical protein